MRREALPAPPQERVMARHDVQDRRCGDPQCRRPRQASADHAETDPRRQRRGADRPDPDGVPAGAPRGKHGPSRRRPEAGGCPASRRPRRRCRARRRSARAKRGFEVRLARPSPVGTSPRCWQRRPALAAASSGGATMPGPIPASGPTLGDATTACALPRTDVAAGGAAHCRFSQQQPGPGPLGRQAGGTSPEAGQCRELCGGGRVRATMRP